MISSLRSGFSVRTASLHAPPWSEGAWWPG